MKKSLAIGLGALLGANVNLAVAAPPPPPHPNLPGLNLPLIEEHFIQDILAIEERVCESEPHGYRDIFGFCRIHLSP